MKYETLIKNIQDKFDRIDYLSSEDEDRIPIIKMAWDIGDSVIRHKEKTGLTTKQIALDSGIKSFALDKYVRFAKLFTEQEVTKLLDVPHITVSHYIELIYVNNKAQRQFYINQSAENGWNVSELRRRLRNNFYEIMQESQSAKERKDLNLKVTSPQQALYTYKADIIKVVDGDTLLINIDVGFKTKMEQKVRLNGINCAEIGTKLGDKAKEFIEAELTADTTGTTGHGYLPIIIRSYKIGKFGRYIIDLWYLKGESDPEKILKNGIWLNQLLVDKKLAVKMG